MQLTPYTRKVYYYETDKMGIAHHSNYIRWFEETRVHLIEEAGLPFETVEQRGIMSPVLAAECEYMLPFRFGDTFIVKAYIPEFGKMRFDVIYEIYGEDGTLHAKGRTSHCFVDTDLRPVRIKKTHPDIYDIYSQICDAGDRLYG
ncbi:MAG: acyl-CoA thioesterase [Oscillospiraceae bacterium]|nr:acyl-CoA thioesterase [Oscillospiraceae bacterium]